MCNEDYEIALEEAALNEMEEQKKFKFSNLPKEAKVLLINSAAVGTGALIGSKLHASKLKTRNERALKGRYDPKYEVRNLGKWLKGSGE